MQSVKIFLILVSSLLTISGLFAAESYDDYVDVPGRFMPEEKVGDFLEYLNKIDQIRNQFNIETVAMNKLEPTLLARTVTLHLPDLWDKFLGHGVLVNVDEHAGILTAAHVYSILCSTQNSPQAIFVSVPDNPQVSLSCADAVLLDADRDIVLWRLKISHELLSRLGKLELSSYKDEKTDRGLELCVSLSAVSPASRIALRDKGHYIESDSFLLPGCSGSGLFANNKLIGIFKGFVWESKASLFEKLDEEVISRIETELILPLQNDRFMVASTSRGDPLDGGLAQGFISLHFMNPFLNRPIPSLRPADGLMHLPDGLLNSGDEIPVMNKTFFDPVRGLLSSREILPSDMVFPSQIEDLKERGWPVALQRLNCVSGKSLNGEPCYKSDIHFTEQSFFLWDAKQDEGVQFPPADYSKTRNFLMFYGGGGLNHQLGDAQVLDETGNAQKIVITNDTEALSNNNKLTQNLEKWTVTLSPGEIRLIDPRISSEEIILKDPNISFRSFMMKSQKFKDEVILYNIGLHFEAPSDPGKEARAIVTVHRAVAPTQKAFFYGTFISFHMVRYEIWAKKKSSWFWPW